MYYLIPPVVYVPMIVLSSVYKWNGLNFGFTNMGILHTGSVISSLSNCSSHPYSKISSFFFLHEKETIGLLTNIYYVIGLTLYKNYGFDRHMCNDCAIIEHTYKTLLILSSIGIFIFSTLLSINIYIFIFHRYDLWKSIVYIEKYINDIGDLNLQKCFECHDDHTYIKQDFITHWTTKSTSDIIEDTHNRSMSILNYMNTIINRDSCIPISYDDFVLIKHIKQSDNLNIRKDIWSLLQNDNVITTTSVQKQLVNFDKKRRVFANLLVTDSIIQKWIITYLGIFLYSLSVVFILNIYGYTQAFGDGIDLLKLYFIAATYFVGVIRQHIKFIFTMSFERPYNIGDLIYYNGDYIVIKKINGMLTQGYGKSDIRIENVSILENLKNISKQQYNDSILIKIPINYSSGKDDIYACLSDDILIRNTIDNIRVECDTLSDSIHITCNYQYVDNIYDRGTLLSMKTKLKNHIYESIKYKCTYYHTLGSAASGGAYNSQITDKIKIL